MLEEILEFNKKFVENRGYEKYITNKYPDKKIAILSCMDTRLTELLPAALGIHNGDVKIIKNAGAVISHPFGSVIRSLLVARSDGHCPFRLRCLPHEQRRNDNSHEKAGNQVRNNRHDTLLRGRF